MPSGRNDTSQSGEPASTKPTAETATGSTACFDAVQGKVAWDYSGSTSWSSANVRATVQGAESSPEPANCFQQVMHDGVDWGGGTQWIGTTHSIYESSLDADATIQCFEAAISGGTDWVEAIAACGKVTKTVVGMLKLSDCTICNEKRRSGRPAHHHR